MPRATTRLHELALACVIAAVVFGCGDDPAGSGDAGFADDVVNYDCEFEADAASSPGMPCTTQCGEGVWTCSEDVVVCSERFNACGGCGRLEHEVGGPCGDGGTWECAGTNAVECLGSDLSCRNGNPCGGCDPLIIDGERITDRSCGTCGQVQCEGLNTAICVDDRPRNDCGSCVELVWNGVEAGPGDSCDGPCGVGVLECATAGRALSCSSRRNACAGCGELDLPEGAELGMSCGTCGEWSCDGRGGVFCDDSPRNACGGCDRLRWPSSARCSGDSCEPGDSCGRCGLGVLTCRGENDVICEGDVTNACGGCGEVTFNGEPATEGRSCKRECVSGTLTCDWQDPEDNRLRCSARGENSRLDRPCGGCGVNTCVDGTEEVCVGDTGCDAADVLRPTDGGRTEEPFRGTFGRHLLLDGDDLLIAADRAADPDLEGAGRVWHRRWNGTEWEVVGVIHPPERHEGQRFGNAMDLDGDWLAIAARNDDQAAYHAGAVYLFERDGLGWTHRQTVVAPEPRENGAFGWDVALSGDRLLVTAWEADTRTEGGGWLFERSDVDGWTLGHRMAAGGFAGALAGDLAVLVDYDGLTLHSFVRVAGEWVTGATRRGYLGSYHPSFNIWTDGTRIVGGRRTGAWLDTVDASAPLDALEVQDTIDVRWLYRTSGSSVPTVEVPRIAYSIAGHDDLLLTGAPRANWRDSAEPSGAAVLWQQDPATGGWAHLRTFDSPGDFPHGNFGHSVDINDRWVAIGEPSAEYDGYEAGAVYVFPRE